MKEGGSSYSIVILTLIINIVFMSCTTHAFRAKDIWDDKSDILTPLSPSDNIDSESDIETNLLNLNSKVISGSDIDSGKTIRRSIDIPTPRADVPFSDEEPSPAAMAKSERDKLSMQIELSKTITEKANALRDAAERARREAESKLNPQQQQQQTQTQQPPSPSPSPSQQTQQTPAVPSSSSSSPSPSPSSSSSSSSSTSTPSTPSTQQQSASSELDSLKKQQKETDQVVKQLKESDDEEKGKKKDKKKDKKKTS